MHKIKVSDKATTYTRIDKRKARSLFNQGRVFAICPHKLRPGLPWAPHMTVYSDECKRQGYTFEQVVAAFAWHNCGDNESGYYPAFYLTSNR
jgi:hypothetical protein